MTQKDRILRLFRERGPRGISAHELVYEQGITRGAAAVFELRLEGHNIETIDEGTLPDGRRRLARYILHETPPAAPVPMRLEISARSPAHPANGAPRSESPLVRYEGEARELRPLRLPCGCVRAADGRSWQSRCASHAEALAR